MLANIREAAEGWLDEVPRPDDYSIDIFHSQDDAGYIADIPDLAACSAFGATPEEALAQVLVAKSAWIDAAADAGRPIPPPRYRPMIYQVV